MNAAGTVDRIWDAGLPLSYTVDNYTGYHAALYDSFADRGDGGLRHYVSRIAPDASVADLACGSGRLTARLVARGNDVVGVDLAPEMLDRARARLARAGAVPGSAEFVHGDVTTWRGARTYDVVTLVGLTYSLFASPGDRLALLRTAAAAVRPGGRVLLDFLPAEGATDAGEHWVYPTRLGTMSGFTLVEYRRCATRLVQIADLYTELVRTDGRVVRLRSTMTSHLSPLAELAELAARCDLHVPRDEQPVRHQEIGSFVVLERGERSG